MNERERRAAVLGSFGNVLGMLVAPDAWDSIVRNTTELVDVGEEGIAFENLVANLHEFDVPINGRLFAEIRRLGEMLQIEPSTWTVLEARRVIVPGSIDDLIFQLIDGCSEESFQRMRCPSCGSRLAISVHRDAKRFFVRCDADTSHLAIHEESRSPQEWFTSKASGAGWY